MMSGEGVGRRARFAPTEKKGKLMDYAETMALKAVMDGDKTEMHRILEDFTPHELQVFIGQLDLLGRAATRIHDDKVLQAMGGSV